MAKKKQFKELSEEDFAKLSPDEQNIYLLDLDKYEKAKGADTVDEDEEQEDALLEHANAFFKANKEYPHSSIFVTSDGNVFHGNLKGKNLVENHCQANGLTYKQFTKD